MPRSDISSGLAAEMDRIHRRPVSEIYVERWLPNWTQAITASFNDNPGRYPIGHDAVLVDNAGSPLLCRVRSGSAATPTDRNLYVAIIEGADLADPSTWESKWVSKVTALLYPGWLASTNFSSGATVQVVPAPNDRLRIFFFGTNPNSTTFFQYMEVDYTGNVTQVPQDILNFGANNFYQDATQIFYATSYNEVFLVQRKLVEPKAGTQDVDTYGDSITVLTQAASGTGAFTTEENFLDWSFQDIGLFRDNPAFRSEAGDHVHNTTIGRFGYAPHGGIYASEIDTNKVLVVISVLRWREWGSQTHTHGIQSFIYYRDAKLWEPISHQNETDFQSNQMLELNSCLTGVEVNGRKYIIWGALREPSDVPQVDSALIIPRLRDIVIAEVTDEGLISEAQRLGEQDQFNSCTIIPVDIAGTRRLYMIGYVAVAWSPACQLIGGVPANERTNISHLVEDWTWQSTNRGSNTLALTIPDPSIIFQTDPLVAGGNIVRVFYGIEGDLVQLAQGHIDLHTPTLTVDPDGNFAESASVNIRADDLLQKTRAERTDDHYPQQIKYIGPQPTETTLPDNEGIWVPATNEWAGAFFPADYPTLRDDKKYMWRSRGVAPQGDWEEPTLQDLITSWWKDVLWLESPVMSQGSCVVTTRMGAIYRYNSPVGTLGLGSTKTVWQHLTYTDGMLQTITLRDTSSPTSPIYYTAPQYSTATGIIFRAPDIGKKYAFIWEAQSNHYQVGSVSFDGWSGVPYDRMEYSTFPRGANYLYLAVTDTLDEIDPSIWYMRIVAATPGTGLTAGRPAQMKVTINGGLIRCFYREHPTGTNAWTPWRFAFDYRTGKHGTNQFGLFARGMSPLQWPAFNEHTFQENLCNFTDFWDIQVVDGARDYTLEDHVKRLSWRGFTPSSFSSLVEEDSVAVADGQQVDYPAIAINPTLEFEVSIAAGAEAGVYIRGVDVSDPEATACQLGIVVNATDVTQGARTPFYVVKRIFSGGAEVVGQRDYGASPVQFRPGVRLPVRITARGSRYNVWIAGRLVASFIDDTALGFYFGLYATGGAATFYNLRLPELYEISYGSPLNPGQSMVEGINTVLGQRRIKQIYDHNGILYASYFNDHPTGPAFREDRLWQSSLSRSPRHFSVVKVQGSDGVYGIAKSDILARKGERYTTISRPEIIYREFAVTEARAIIQELAELQEQSTFIGLPDVRVIPEDRIQVVVNRQNLAGEYIVDDINLGFTMGDSPDTAMQLSTRQTVIILREEDEERRD